MTISKAVELLMKFVDANSDAKIETKEDCDKVDNDLEKFIRSKHKNEHEFSYKLKIAESKEFIIFDYNANTLGEGVTTTEKFADYILSKESNSSKFLHGLIGSIVTVVGGVIGAVIGIFT